MGQWLLRGTEVRDVTMRGFLEEVSIQWRLVRDVTMGGFLEEVSLQWRLEGLMEEELTQ